MKFFMFVLIFVCVGLLLIVSNNNLALCQPDDLSKFSELCFVWADLVFENAQTISGEVVKLSWFPE
jgi:hypothetical protein